MGRELNDLIAHNAWATQELLAYCRGLDDATLAATVPGTFGSILATLQHLINAEASYTWRLTGAWPDHPWRDDAEVGLDVLAERAAVLADAQAASLAGDWDTEALGQGGGSDGTRFAIRAGIFLTQAIHHANEHRAHVCTILGALGHQPPDVSAWGYALATGRMWPEPPPAHP